MYKKFLSPVLDRCNSELMHDLAREALCYGERTELTRRIIRAVSNRGARVVSPKLQTIVSGITFENPLVVGAGWDKVGHSVRGLWEMGFAGVEVGSVLEHPQPGNPKPRQFVVGPGVAIQSLGFNSPGMEVVARNLERYRGLNIPIGVNIGKNRDVSEEDAPRAYAVVAKRLYQYADYFVINVSSPNTPGLRNLQGRPQLTAIIVAVQETLQFCGGLKPTFVKIAPELSDHEVSDVISVVLEHKLNGIIAVNTTNNPDIKGRYGAEWRNSPGGLSGDDAQYRSMATEKIRFIHRETQGKIEIIGIGGVRDGATAIEKIRAGAKLVQIVTAIRGEGPTVAAETNRQILAYMDREGVSSIAELVGVDAR